MEIVTKIVVVIWSLCTVAVLGDFIMYEWKVVRPVEADVQKILAQADPEDRDPSPVVRRAILANYGSDSILATSVARNLTVHGMPAKEVNPGAWMVRSFLTGLVCSQLSEKQLIGLHAVLTYNGVDHGMNGLSRRLFDKPLHQVSEDQAVTLEAFLWSPGIYRDHPDALNARRARIQARLEAQNQPLRTE
jgi:hypothetical protein